MGREAPNDLQFTRWVGAGRHREAAAWLVNHFADEVLGLCLAMVRDQSAAEDLAQDAFGRAFVGLAGYRGEASPRTWLLKIARNRCIDHLRTRERKPWDDPGVDAGEPELQPDDAPLPSDLLLYRDDVEDALAKLGAIERALVVLRFRNGLDYAELATAFGLGEGAVRMRLSRALARMRRFLEAKHDEGRATVLAEPLPAAAPAEPAGALFEMEEAAEELALDNDAFAVHDDAVTGSFGQAPESQRERVAHKSAARPAALPPRTAPGAPPAQAVAARSAPASPPPSRAAKTEAPREDELSLEQAPPDLVAAPQAARGGGLIGWLVEFFHREPLPPPSPPVEHPLTAYFAATREALPMGLRDRLLAQARSIAG
jgi:RNA polymerase sigma-70 factor (ECF subfamily)